MPAHSFSHPRPSYNPEELVRVRRALVTGGDYVSCPRCRSAVTVGRRRAANDRSTCRVHCDTCGCAVTMQNLPYQGLMP